VTLEETSDLIVVIHLPFAVSYFLFCYLLMGL